MQDELQFVPLSELAWINPSLPKALPDKDKTVSFIAMADVSEGGQWTSRQIRRVRDVGFGYTAFQEEDVLFAKITPCMENGKGCHARDLINGVGFGSTEFHVLRAKPGTSTRYLYHWSQSVNLRLKAESMMTGSAGQQRVPSEFFDLYLIPNLPSHEQRRIAAVLDALDEAIAATEALVAKLTLMRQGLLHDLLTRGLDEHGDLRDPERHPQQFKESEMGRVPRGWGVKTVAECCIINNHLRLPISAEERNKIRGPYPYYGPTGIVDFIDHYRISGKFALIGEDGDHFLKYNTWDMTILVNGDFNVNNHAHVISGTECCLTEWFFNFFRHRDITLYLSRQGAGRFKLNKATLSRLPMALPKVEEQKAIISFLDAYVSRLHTEQAYLAKLRQMKRGLMDDLLTGRVRVPPAESAEALETIS
ncbi:MAG: hypothetical protein HGA45_19945 [Chloroflexales bacterium]|nr:hypothetical protein [Chloroflexales bacterium]